MSNRIYTEENGDYLQKNPTWHVEDSPWKAKQIRKMLDRNNLKPRSVVEIGCGVGEILNQLYNTMPDNVQFTGYDISRQIIDTAKERAKDRLQFIHADLLEEPVKFDLLLMIDVFEHVDDYLGFIRKSSEKTDFAIFHIPLDLSASTILRNSPMALRHSVGHLHYFTKETALASISDSGYQVIDFFYTSLVMDTPKRRLRSKLASFVRKTLYSIKPDFTARLMGGFSLLVLAQSPKTRL